VAVLVVVLLWVLSYLLGSFPTGYLVARWAKGIDIRQHGSGGTGATNVLRTVGKEAAIAVLFIDLLKGMASVLLVQLAFPAVLAMFPQGAVTLAWQPWVEVGAGLLAIVGHSRSIWINFTGGKSAASGLGILLALAWPVALGAIAAFGITLGLSRIVSLGSMVAAVTTIGLMFASGQPLAYGAFAIIGGVYVILRHRTNIERLLAGTEPRLGRQASE
jgi:glycerol-3-phosphate acyltransferase PlsY